MSIEEAIKKAQIDLKTKLKSTFTELQPVCDQTTALFNSQLRPYAAVARATDSRFRFIITPECSIVAHDIAPDYGINISLKWVLFSLFENKPEPFANFMYHINKTNIDAWNHFMIIAQKFDELGQKFGVEVSTMTLPKPDKVVTIMAHKRFTEV